MSTDRGVVKGFHPGVYVLLFFIHLYFFPIYLTIFSQFIVIVSGDLNYGPDGNAVFRMGRTSFWRTCLVSFITLLKQNNPSTKKYQTFSSIFIVIVVCVFFCSTCLCVSVLLFFYFFISQTTVGVM